MLTLIRCVFHPRVTAVACKRPGHSAKSADGRLRLNTHIPLTQQSQSGLTMPLSRCSVRTYQETSSHATCQGTLGHSRLSPLSQAQATLHLKKKKRRRGLNCQTFSPNPHKRGKATTTPQAVALPPPPASQFLLFQLSTPIPIPSGALRL